MDERGMVWVLYFRDCEATRQYTWVPNLSPQQLGQIAFDELVRKLPKPAPRLSPDAGAGGWVNFETWLAVADPGIVSATASIPGLSATATARVSRIDWDPGDGGSLSCEPFGALPPTPDYTGPSPCGHTYQRPSVSSATGSDDLRYHGSITLVWSVTWTASNGAAGDLGEARSSAPFAYRVREIQTIGQEG
jgi:hypothetical protein